MGIDRIQRVLGLAGLAALAVSMPRPATGQAPAPPLPALVREELAAAYFMNEAVELLIDHPTPASARQRLATVAETVQYVGSQTVRDVVTDGYVARVPETFVSVTLFYEGESEALTIVHVVMSPGMRSRALLMIEGAFDFDPAVDPGFGDATHYLGVQDAQGRPVHVYLTEQASELGTIHAINYMATPRAEP